MSKTTQDEGEKNAKVWQVNEVSNKLDQMMERIESLTKNHPSKEQVELGFLARDNRLDSLEKTRRLQTKITWFVLTTYIPVVLVVAWDKVKHL